MKKFFSLVLILLHMVTVMGCSTASKDISAAYVSPAQYAQYDCSQLSAELMRLQSRITQLGGRLDEAASNDAALTAAGVILFFPVLFALGGTKQQEAEYSRLKGEYDAVSQAAIMRKCGVGSAPVPVLTDSKPDPAVTDTK